MPENPCRSRAHGDFPRCAILTSGGARRLRLDHADARWRQPPVQLQHGWRAYAAYTFLIGCRDAREKQPQVQLQHGKRSRQAYSCLRESSTLNLARVGCPEPPRSPFFSASRLTPCPALQSDDGSAADVFLAQPLNPGEQPSSGEDAIPAQVAESSAEAQGQVQQQLRVTAAACAAWSAWLASAGGEWLARADG